MKKSTFVFIVVLMLLGFNSTSQNASSRIIQNQPIVNHWYEAPESSKGDTVVFKLSAHVLGANEDPAYAWSEFTAKANNTFEIKYWRWCPSGNYAYSGTWSSPASGKIIFDFGAGKCKCELQIISSSNNELKAIIKETTN